MDGLDSGQFISEDSYQMAELSEQEKALRDFFIDEYMKDFDAYLSAIRCGFLPAFAVVLGKKLLSCTYVQKEITSRTRKAPTDEGEQLIADKALIENTLRQAMQHGQYSARIAAARTLSEMKGLSKPDASAGEETNLINLFKEFAQRAPV